MPSGDSVNYVCNLFFISEHFSTAAHWKRHQLHVLGDALPLLHQQAGDDETEAKTGGRSWRSESSVRKHYLNWTQWNACEYLARCLFSTSCWWTRWTSRGCWSWSVTSRRISAQRHVYYLALGELCLSDRCVLSIVKRSSIELSSEGWFKIRPNSQGCWVIAFTKSGPLDRQHFFILNTEPILELLLKQVLDETNPKQGVFKMMMVQGK